LVSLQFSRLARESQALPDVIVCSLPDHNLAFEACRFATDNGIPFILDIRDPWPDRLMEVFPKRMQPLARFVLGRDHLRTRHTLGRADAVVSMLPEFLSWGQAKGDRTEAQRSADRVFHLGARDIGCVALDSSARRIQLCGTSTERIVVLYLGTFGRAADTSTILSAARELEMAHAGRYLFVMAGVGPDLEQAKREADGLSNVVFLGWVNSLEAGELCCMADLGISPQDATLPNKFYTYVSGGLPVLAPDGVTGRVIEEEAIGGTYVGGSVSTLVGALEKMGRLAESERARIRTVFERQFSASRIYSAFADHIENVSRADHQ